MRLLYWTELFWPYIGGIQVLAGQLLPALRERGHDVAVVTCHKSAAVPDIDEYAGITIHRFAVRDALASHDVDQLGQIVQAVAALKQRFKPDVVHLNFAGPSMWLYFKTASRTPAPLVLAFRGLPEGDCGPESLFQHAVGSAAWVVGVSRAVLSAVCDAAPAVIPKSSVILNAAPEPSIAPTALPFTAPRLLCLGRLVEEKRFCLAVAAMPRVLAEFPGAMLLIAGDGPERVRLERQVSELGLASATRFLNWVVPDKVPDLLNETTLLLMPSRIEGCPNVAIQAAYMRRPVIGMRVGGLPEVVQHPETGYLLDDHGSEALGEAICTLLHRPGEAITMGHAARLRARRLFDWQRHIDAYENLYRKVV